MWNNGFAETPAGSPSSRDVGWGGDHGQVNSELKWNESEELRLSTRVVDNTWGWGRQWF